MFRVSQRGEGIDDADMIEVAREMAEFTSKVSGGAAYH
jgi:hypothetical protein